MSLRLPSLIDYPGVRAIGLPGFSPIEYGLMWNKAAREYCAYLRLAVKSAAETRFRVSSSGKLLKVIGGNGKKMRQ